MPEIAPMLVEERNFPRRSSLRPALSLSWLLLLLTFFLLLYGMVTPTEGGDTVRYAADAVQHAHGHAAQFWEFGHLLWRPWGYLGLQWLGPWFERHYGDSEIQAVTRFFVWTNFACSLGTVIFIWGILQRLVSLPLATAIALAFCGANGFLGYVTLGSAYIPALCFECLSLWILVTRARQEGAAGTVATAAAGFSYGVCVLLWFPFAFIGLGMIAALFWRPSQVKVRTSGDSRIEWRRAVLFILATAVVTIVGFTAGASAYGAHNAGDVKRWIAEADNGWSQRLNIVRAATGVPRSLYELTSGNIFLKRWFFHDPYNPVHLSQLAGALFLKLLLFYVGVLAILWALRKGTERSTLFMLLSAAVPSLFFAIFIFEPGSTSRYVPVLPFLYMAAAVALEVSRARPLVFGTIAALLASVVMFNAWSLSHGSFAAAEEVRRQTRLLENDMTRPASVFVPTLRDPLYYVPLTRPLDHTLVSRKYNVTDVIEIASTRLLHWRAEFAARALQNWKAGSDVWVSKKLLAARPTSGGTWVEGDDPRIKWKELPDFFGQFATDRSEGGEDGCVRVSESPANRIILQKVIERDPGFKNGQAGKL